MDENPFESPTPAQGEIRRSRLRAWHALLLVFVSLAAFVASIAWGQFLYVQRRELTPLEQNSVRFLMFFFSWTFLMGLGLSLWLFIVRPPFRVIGDISREDINAVVAVIKGNTYVRARHLLTMTVSGSDEVEVRIKGKWDRGIRLQKSNGAWHLMASGAIYDEARAVGGPTPTEYSN